MESLRLSGKLFCQSLFALISDVSLALVFVETLIAGCHRARPRAKAV